jgi:hypothetical protein
MMDNLYCYKITTFQKNLKVCVEKELQSGMVKIIEYLDHSFSDKYRI